MASAEVIARRFRAKFAVEPTVIASAPGRVNLVGEHTDYNDGFTLPMAIDRRLFVAVSPRDDTHVAAYAESFGEQCELDLAHVNGRGPRHWNDYVAGVFRAFAAERHVPGMNVYISTGVPIGAGVSSSAALEIALARAIAGAVGIDWDPVRMARLAQRAEHEYIGVNCGIMDQVAASSAREGTALLLDCRTLETSYVDLPDDVTVVVMDTGVRRTLSTSDYNARRSVCEYVVKRVRSIAPNVQALRDVNRALLDTARVLLDATAYRRARHVVEENERPAAMARALRGHDYEAAGALLDDSHTSLRELYEVSSPHLDIACEEARAHARCYGARMTGAGFGGCAIALVASGGVEDFIQTVQPRYEARSYKRSDFFMVRPDAGARLEVPRAA
ncbi:MAG: galactokinase [Gemmatimonadaceae bacterium]